MFLTVFGTVIGVQRQLTHCAKLASALTTHIDTEGVSAAGVGGIGGIIAAVVDFTVKDGAARPSPATAAARSRSS